MSITPRRGFRLASLSLAAILFGAGTPKVSIQTEPPRRIEPKVSLYHNRQWCTFHGTVCCMRHGKHKQGKILRGPRRN